MKKTYLSPETLLVLVATQKMIAASVDGFNKNLEDDKTIGVDDMLSRRKRNDVWEEDEEEEEY